MACDFKNTQGAYRKVGTLLNVGMEIGQEQGAEITMQAKYYLPDKHLTTDQCYFIGNRQWEEGFQFQRPVRRIIADPVPSQRAQMTARAQCGTEVVRKAPDVCARGTNHLEPQSGQFDLFDQKNLYGDRPGIDLYLDSLAGGNIERLSVLFDRGMLRRVLKYIADKGFCRSEDFRFGQMGKGLEIFWFRFQVIALRGAAEGDFAAICFFHPHIVVDFLGHLPRAKDQQPGGQRIERSGMAHFFGLGGMPDFPDHVETGQAQGFVYK